MSEQIFLLPDVGEGLTEAEILSWHVKVGDEVTVNQTIVEIETAKAAVELPCPYAGVITAIHVAAGDVVPVGAPIMTIGTAGAVPAAPIAATPAPESAAPAGGEPKREAVLVGYGVRDTSGATRRRASRRPRRTGRCSRRQVRPARPSSPCATAGSRWDATPRRCCPGRARCWPSRRCASSPATSGWTSPSWTRQVPTGS